MSFLSVLNITNVALAFQRRQGQPDFKSWSEKFNPYPQEVASGFPIDPTRPSQAVASNADADGNRQKRASHSGPLAHRAAWTNSGNNLDDAPKFSIGATDLSMILSLVAARRSNLVSEDHKEKSQNHNVQQKGYGRSNNKDAVPVSSKLRVFLVLLFRLFRFSVACIAINIYRFQAPDTCF